MNPIYCGNNANHPDLLNGDRVLGTRYSCLQKGKSNGYSQPVDPNFLLPYQPIDQTKKYCGNNGALPGGYDRYGGLYECYLKGMGVGKRLKAQAGMPGGDGSSSPPPSPPYNSPNSSELYGRSNKNDMDFDIKSERDDSKESVYSSNDGGGDDKYDDKYSGKREYSYSIFSNKKYIVGGIVYVMGLTIFFLGMYYGKPEIILDKNTNTNEGSILTFRTIDWSKFIPYLVSFAVIYAVVIYFFINYLFR
jgi:hypothetical protein